MSEKVFEIATVVSQKELQPGIFDLRLSTKAAKTAKPGQFVNIYPKDESKRLPRPISICGIEKEEEILRFVYRVTKAGSGTEEFSGYKEGDKVKVLGPLGNGFPIEEYQDAKVILMGGGIGIPPMLGIANELAKAGKDATGTAVLGYRDKNTFLVEDFEAAGTEVVLASDDGSIGTHGNVIDALKENKVCGDVIFACGPTPMLRGIKAYAKEAGITCYVSLEERMACGVGACLGCVCQSKDVDDHSKVNNKRVCKDGPVFLAEEVEL